MATDRMDLHEDESFPEFIDILMETHTRQADWVINLRRISEAMGYHSFTPAVEAIRSGKLPTTKVKNLYPGNQKFTYIARKEDIEKWKEEQTADIAPLLFPSVSLTEEIRNTNALLLVERRLAALEETHKMLYHQIITFLQEFK